MLLRDCLLLHYGIENTLTNPPDGIRSELEPTCLVILLRSPDESCDATGHKHLEAETLVLKQVCYRIDEPRISFHLLSNRSHHLR